MTNIDILLAEETVLHQQAMLRDLHGIRVDSPADLMAVYNGWLNTRPVAYRNAVPRFNDRRLYYPCRVVFTATISSTGGKLIIETHLLSTPI